jgi:chemotaxis signal transduction protein
VTRVPGTPAWLAGVVNWRGRVLPALDLRVPLGAAAVPLDDRARLLVVGHDGVSVALLVERVEGTATLGSRVEPFPAALSAVAADLLSGQVPAPDGPVAVLDVAAVVRLRAALPQAGRVG